MTLEAECIRLQAEVVELQAEIESMKLINNNNLEAAFAECERLRQQLATLKGGD